jgi:hypothetical protein
VTGGGQGFMLALCEQGVSLGKERIELGLLIGDSVRVALLVGSSGEGRSLLLELTQIVLDDLDASLDL